MAKKVWKSTTVTHVAMIIDVSGSMGNSRPAQLYNAAVDALRATKFDGDVVLHPIWFGCRVRADPPIHLDDAPRLNECYIANLTVGGSTNLMGGIKRAWEQMREYECRAGNVAMLGLLITDGGHNSGSTTFAEVKALMDKTQQSGQWTWCYMGTACHPPATNLPWHRKNLFHARKMEDVAKKAKKGLKAYMEARYKGLQSIDDMVARA